MDRHTILERLDAERREIVHFGSVIEIDSNVSRLRASDSSHRKTISSSLTAANADEVIEREIAHHRALGLPFEWKLYAHDKPTNLLDRLRSHGFAIGPQETVLILDVSDPPAWVKDAGTIICARADDPTAIGDYRRVAEAVFDKDFTFTATQLLEALRAGATQHRAYVAYGVGHEPVSIGRLYTHPASVFGGLFGGGTLPAFRGQGFYRATLAARARDAITLGALYLIVDARPTSRPILERLGFQHLSDTWPCEWRP